MLKFSDIVFLSSLIKFPHLYQCTELHTLKIRLTFQNEDFIDLKFIKLKKKKNDISVGINNSSNEIFSNVCFYIFL